MWLRATGKRCTTGSLLLSGRTGHVVLSFLNVSTLTSAFLNTAVGQLYGEFDENHIRELLKAEDMEAEDRALLKRVVDTAKLYFKDPERFNRAVRETLEGDEDDAQ